MEWRLEEDWEIIQVEREIRTVMSFVVLRKTIEVGWEDGRRDEVYEDPTRDAKTPWEGNRVSRINQKPDT